MLGLKRGTTPLAPYICHWSHIFVYIVYIYSDSTLVKLNDQYSSFMFCSFQHFQLIYVDVNYYMYGIMFVTWGGGGRGSYAVVGILLGGGRWYSPICDIFQSSWAHFTTHLNFTDPLFL